MLESLIVREPVFIEAGGQPVAVLLPIEVYRSLLAGKSSALSESLLTAHSDPNARSDPKNEMLLREQKAFEAIHVDLLANYLGQYVAMMDGKVIDHDQNQYELWLRIDKSFRDMPVLIKPVLSDPVERYMRRSPRIAYE